MTRSEFVEWLEADVTLSGTLNIGISEKEYNRIIDNELLTMYQINPMAVKKEFAILPVQLFYTPEFKRTRKIQFPKCVKSIGKFVEMRHRSWLGFNDPAFGADRLFGMPFTTWGVIGGIVELDSVMWRTIGMSTWDQLKCFTLVDCQHTFAEATSQLLVTGHTPRTHVYCEPFVTLEDTYLFDDPYVRKWISAHAKLQAAKQIGIFTTTLISNVTVNYSILVDEANKDIENCKNFWNTMIQSDHFFLTTP